MRFTIDEIKILKLFGIELEQDDIYRIPNENNYDYLMKGDDHRTKKLERICK